MSKRRHDDLRVFVLDDLEGAAERSAPWAQLPDGAKVTFVRHHVAELEALADLLRDADVVVLQRERTRVGDDLLSRLPRLKLIVTTGERNAAIDLTSATRLGVTVCGTRGSGTPVVELAWAHLLSCARSLTSFARSMHEGEWLPEVGRSVEGSTLGLIGLGRTGTRMAAIAQAFGMKVVAWSTNLDAAAARHVGVGALPLDEVLDRADFLSIHTQLSERTRGLLGARELELLGPTSWLINTSRGPIVDEGALISACESGAIAGAALDVFDEEPLPADHPLRSLPNVLLTPHIGYVTAENYRAWFSDAVEAINAWISGMPVRALN